MHFSFGKSSNVVQNTLKCLICIKAYIPGIPIRNYLYCIGDHYRARAIMLQTDAGNRTMNGPQQGIT